VLRSSLRLCDGEPTSFAIVTWRGGCSFNQLQSLTITLQNTFEPRCPVNASINPSHHLFTHDYEDSTCCQPGHVQHSCEKVKGQDEWMRSQERIEQDLDALRQILATDLRSLVTFSLTIDNEPRDGKWCLCYKSPLPSDLFVGVINAIYPTCRHFELDTRGADEAWGRDHFNLSAPSHICPALAQLTVQLKSLRLRVSGLCPNFLSMQHSPGSQTPCLAASSCHRWMWTFPTKKMRCSMLSSRGRCIGPGTDIERWEIWRRLKPLRKKVSRHKLPQLRLILSVFRRHLQPRAQK
jgi:hypothetical protein